MISTDGLTSVSGLGSGPGGGGGLSSSSSGGMGLGMGVDASSSCDTRDTGMDTVDGSSGLVGGRIAGK